MAATNLHDFLQNAKSISHTYGLPDFHSKLLKFHDDNAFDLESWKTDLGEYEQSLVIDELKKIYNQPDDQMRQIFDSLRIAIGLDSKKALELERQFLRQIPPYRRESDPASPSNKVAGVEVLRNRSLSDFLPALHPKLRQSRHSLDGDEDKKEENLNEMDDHENAASLQLSTIAMSTAKQGRDAQSSRRRKSLILPFFLDSLGSIKNKNERQISYRRESDPKQWHLSKVEDALNRNESASSPSNKVAAFLSALHPKPRQSRHSLDGDEDKKEVVDASKKKRRNSYFFTRPKRRPSLTDEQHQAYDELISRGYGKDDALRAVKQYVPSGGIKSMGGRAHSAPSVFPFRLVAQKSVESFPTRADSNESSLDERDQRVDIVTPDVDDEYVQDFGSNSTVENLPGMIMNASQLSAIKSQNSQSLSRHSSSVDFDPKLYTYLYEDSDLNLKRCTGSVVFESVVQLNVTQNELFTDFGALLTDQEELLLVPIQNYEIWKQLAERTKMKQLVDDEEVITETQAAKMAKNLNLFHHDEDEKADLDDLNGKIISFFITKESKAAIQKDILHRKVPISSLVELFGLSVHESAANARLVKYVRIANVDKLPNERLKKLTKVLFEDIPFTDVERVKHEDIVTLKQYACGTMLIEKLTQRNKQFWANSDEDDLGLDFTATNHRYNALPNPPNYRISHVDKELTTDIPSCVHLQLLPVNSQAGSDDDDEITLQLMLSSNNETMEWRAWLDYAHHCNTRQLHTEEKEEPDDIDTNESKQETCTETLSNAVNPKFMNEFVIVSDDDEKETVPVFDDDDEKEIVLDYGVPWMDFGVEFSKHFAFGEYFNYWQRGYTNSVIPKYSTLKEELTCNEIDTINEQEYYELFEAVMSKCKENKKRVYGLRVALIGVNNKKFGIRKGTPITINHILALKVYTDYSTLQELFNRNCRKQRKSQSTEQLIQCNREIAIWCRLLKELCTFYGTIMKPKMFVFTGLETKLVFNSLNNNFECPLSTTTSWQIAQKFADDDGIILKLKRTCAKTRYFDASLFSDHPHEEERLFVGSSLQIVDIYIKGISSKNDVAAIRLFEKIINGRQFIDSLTSTEQVEDKLYLLMCFVLDPTGSKTPPPKYYLALFVNLLLTMTRKHSQHSLWIDMQEIEAIRHGGLKELLKLNFFRQVGIDLDKVNSVQRYEWVIKEAEYKDLQDMKSRCYIDSQPMHYNLIDYENQTLTFHLETCAQYNDESNQVAIFFHLDTMPANMQADQEKAMIEMDILCILFTESDVIYETFQHYTSAQMLSNNPIGSRVFDKKVLSKCTSMQWKIGIRVFKPSLRNRMETDLKYIVTSLEQGKNDQVYEYCKQLLSQNQTLQTTNFETQQRWKMYKRQQMLYASQPALAFSISAQSEPLPPRAQMHQQRVIQIEPTICNPAVDPCVVL